MLLIVANGLLNQVRFSNSVIIPRIPIWGLNNFLFAKKDMLIKRKDHACAFVKIDEERGVLVSGGVDAEDNLLDSVEFYNLDTQQWSELSPLKRARTVS